MQRCSSSFSRAVASLVCVLSIAVSARSVAAQAATTQTAKARVVEDARVRELGIRGSLSSPRPAIVVLPSDYDASSSRYPVLYLLHGLGGSYRDWLDRTNLLAYSARLRLIVVLPDAANSWYANSATDSTLRFADYIGKDVVEYVDAHFRTLPFPQARYIAGLSMGGYGALELATANPGRFSFAGSLSGAFTPIRDWDQESVVQAFGPVGSEARKEADFARLLRSADTARLPYYYLDCGESDPLLSGSREVASILSERKLPYEYHEVRGVHEWEYWNRRLPRLLDAVTQVMGRLQPAR